MLASTLPPWKAELLEKKRVSNLKPESVTIPIWKRDLLQRLHTKAEAVKLKMDAESKINQEKLVLDEHILKVSENIFMRQEYNRKMSSAFTSMKAQAATIPDFNQHGLHIIRTDNMVIIERETSTNEPSDDVKIKDEMVDFELPSAGIVNRLKDRFMVDEKHEITESSLASHPTMQDQKRSKSSNDILGLGDKEEYKEVKSPLSPSHSRTYSFPQRDSSSMRPATYAGKPRQRLASIDMVTPKAFTRKVSDSSAPEPFHKVTSPPVIKKFTAPLKKSPSVEKDDPVSMSCLHASGSPKHGNMNTTVQEKLPSLPNIQTDKPHKGASKDTTALHSGNYKEEKKPKKVQNEIVYKPEVLTLDPIETGSKSAPVHRVSKKSDAKQKDKNHIIKPMSPPELKAPTRPERNLNPVKTPRSPVKTIQTLPASNKENIPEVPKRRAISYTKDRATTTTPTVVNQNKSLSSTKINERADECKIVDLGKISMDPSQLTTKAAIAANEIMKESKTLLIIPKIKSPASNSTTNVQKKPSENDKVDSVESKSLPSVATKIKEMEKPRSPGIEVEEDVPKSVQYNLDNGNTANASKDKAMLQAQAKKLPTSSVDDVIVTSSVDDVIAAEVVIKPVSVTKTSKPKNGEPAIMAVDGKVKKDTTLTTPSTIKSTTLVNKTQNNLKTATPISSNRNTVTNNKSSTEDSVKPLFSLKANKPASGGRNNFGGNSFIIDPSKFKKSSAQPASKTINSTKKNSTTSNGNTRMIVPKSQFEEVDGKVNDDLPVPPKGKRKLTVDQIQVIGGYVKLDHSTLAKPNKIRKANSVRFEESRLESIYQYPSEASLLNEQNENTLNQQMSSLAHQSGVLKESQLGKYTTKYLLAMKDKLEEEDDDESEEVSSSKIASEKSTNSTDATPLDDAEAFSSSSSTDLLF